MAKQSSRLRALVAETQMCATVNGSARFDVAVDSARSERSRRMVEWGNPADNLRAVSVNRADRRRMKSIARSATERADYLAHLPEHRRAAAARAIAEVAKC